MTGAHTDGKPMVHCETGNEWREWLAANHATSQGVWLVVWKKHTARPTIDYPETVDEALCYGWVDSRPNKLDDDRAMRWFTPRNPTSPWSRINKAKIAALADAGRLEPAGKALVAVAKTNGAWTIYDEIEDLVIPRDLATALADHSEAKRYFARFSDSSKKSILWWIKTAKTDTTRAKRIATTIERAAANRMATTPLAATQDPADQPEAKPHVPSKAPAASSSSSLGQAVATVVRR